MDCSYTEKDGEEDAKLFRYTYHTTPIFQLAYQCMLHDVIDIPSSIYVVL